MDALLRTPDHRFESLPDYPYLPHYVDLPDGAGGSVRMHYVDEGNGRLGELVLLHGQGSWSFIYRHMIPVLVAAGFRVLAPDFIGFGRSDKPTDAAMHTHANHVAWLGAFVDQVCMPGAHAFCFDWGGHFALRMATARPARFGRLILSNAQPPLPNAAGKAWFLAWRERMFAAPEFPIAGMVQEGVLRTLSPAEVAGYEAPFPDERYKLGPRSFPLMHPVVLEGAEAEDYELAWTEMRAWTRPVLTLFCEREARHAEAVQAHIPGAAGQPHRLVPHCSFFLQEDQSPALAENIVAFLLA